MILPFWTTNISYLRVSLSSITSLLTHLQSDLTIFGRATKSVVILSESNPHGEDRWELAHILSRQGLRSAIRTHRTDKRKILGKPPFRAETAGFKTLPEKAVGIYHDISKSLLTQDDIKITAYDWFVPFVRRFVFRYHPEFSIYGRGG